MTVTRTTRLGRNIRDFFIVAAVFLVAFLAIGFFSIATAIVLWALWIGLVVALPVGTWLRRRALRSMR